MKRLQILAIINKHNIYDNRNSSDQKIKQYRKFDMFVTDNHLNAFNKTDESFKLDINTC